MRKNTCKRSFSFLWIILLTWNAQAQSLSEKLAKSAIKNQLDSGAQSVSKADHQNILTEGLAAVWERTGTADYYQYIRTNLDKTLDENAKMDLNNGSSLLLLYRVSGEQKYYQAANLLREKLKMQPQFLDNSLYFAQPFLAQYAAVFNEQADFNAIANSFISAEKQTQNAKNNPLKSISYAMSLVDVLEYFPEKHPQQKTLVDILNRCAATFQRDKNPEISKKYNLSDLILTAKSVYVLAKGARLGFLPEKYKTVAKTKFNGIKIALENVGNSNIPSENLGDFMLAANETELINIPQNGKNQTVMLDSYFNNEFMKNAAGQTIPFHYKWDEMDNNGFYFFKNAFNYRGVKTATLRAAPSAENLKSADIYLIVDPDTQKETEKPNYVTEKDANAVANWVKAGGVLVVFANDAGNCDLSHLNILTEKFGIHFNEDSRNKVTGNQFEMGSLQIPPADPIFKTAKKVYLKEISTIKITPPAVASFTEGKDVIFATAKFGKGTVFAVGDPWFYNEYTDGRKLPADFDNLKACTDLVSWLIKQVPGKSK